jgi:protocatechuate 3,4-dioxygenase beta subunit
MKIDTVRNQVPLFLTIVVLALAWLVLQPLASPLIGQDRKSLPLTPSDAEGPYWKSGSPERETLYRPGDRGEKIHVSGRVLDNSGKAISRAKIDIWQTDAEGKYDNSGFGYRSHIFGNSAGHYSFKTVKPGVYPSRTPHIHVKISTADGRNLTTQLYFPDYAEHNRRDFLYNKKQNVTWKSQTQAVFDFVLRAR